MERGRTNRCYPGRVRATTRTPGGDEVLPDVDGRRLLSPPAFAAVHETGVPPVSLEMVVGAAGVFPGHRNVLSGASRSSCSEPGEQLAHRRGRRRRGRGTGKREHEQRRRHEQEREAALHALPPCRSDRSTTTSKATLERPSARSANAPRVNESLGVPDTATAAAVGVAATRIAWFAFREVDADSLVPETVSRGFGFGSARGLGLGFGVCVGFASACRRGHRDRRRHDRLWC